MGKKKTWFWMYLQINEGNAIKYIKMTGLQTFLLPYKLLTRQQNVFLKYHLSGIWPSEKKNRKPYLQPTGQNMLAKQILQALARWSEKQISLVLCLK